MDVLLDTLIIVVFSILGVWSIYKLYKYIEFKLNCWKVGEYGEIDPVWIEMNDPSELEIYEVLRKNINTKAYSLLQQLRYIFLHQRENESELEDFDQTSVDDTSQQFEQLLENVRQADMHGYFCRVPLKIELDLTNIREDDEAQKGYQHLKRVVDGIEEHNKMLLLVSKITKNTAVII